MSDVTLELTHEEAMALRKVLILAKVDSAHILSQGVEYGEDYTTQINDASKFYIKTVAAMQPYYARERGDKNIWGTLKSDIDADEFCVECERENPRHYANCPEYRR